MELELTFGHAFCCCPTFIINGIKANEDDFGEKQDHSPETAEDPGCGDMQFTMTEAKPEILQKYKINTTEYNFICEKLKEGLSFGCCGWCV